MQKLFQTGIALFMICTSLTGWCQTGQIPTTMVLSGPSSSVLGSTITLTATVSAGGGAQVAGIVRFSSSSGPFPECTGELVAGVRSCTVTFSSPGGKQIVAEYLGSSEFSGAYAQLQHTVKYQISISKTGSGQGRVTAPGIDCGQDCVGDFDPFTGPVTLHAEPSPGSVFKGWDGYYCGGENGTPCSVAYARENTVVVARFEVDSYQPGTPRSAHWFAGENGAVVAGGRTEYFEAPEYSFSAIKAYGDDGIDVSVNGVSRSNVTLISGTGSLLTPGIYEHMGFASSNLRMPLLGLSLESTSCSRPATGGFSVLEVGYAADGTIAKLAADYEMRCESPISPAVFGEIRFNSALPLTFQKPPGSTTPNPFAFVAAIQAQPGVVVESGAESIYGINAQAPIAIVGGEYRVNEGPWMSTASTVMNRDRVQVRVASSATPGVTVSATLTVGGVSAPFTVTTYDPSLPVTVFWMESPTNYLVGNARTIKEYSPPRVIAARNHSSAQPAEGVLVSLNTYVDHFDVKLAAPLGKPLQVGSYENELVGKVIQLSGNGTGCYDVGRFSILDLGYNLDGTLKKVAANFEVKCGSSSTPIFGEVRFNSTVPLTSMKPAGSTAPDPFSFLQRQAVPASATVESNEVRVYGINSPSQISVANGEYSINGGAWTNGVGTVSPRDLVRVKQTSSGQSGTTTNAILTIGGVSSTFSVTTYQPGEPQTALWYQAAQGDSGSQPGSYFYQSPDWTFRTTAFGLGEARIELPDRLLTLNLRASTGSSLQVGAFELASGYSSGLAVPTGPQLDFMSYGCSAKGRFVILELERNPDASIKRLAVNFERACSPQFVPLYGEWRINSTVPLSMQKPAGSTTPDFFEFLPKSMMPTSEWIQSNEVRIYGINAPANISIAGGQYRINDGSWTSSPGVINNLDRLQVSVFSSAAPNSLSSAVVTVGGRSVNFNVTTYLPGQIQSGFRYQSDTGEPIGQGRTAMLQPPSVLVAASLESDYSLTLSALSGTEQFLIYVRKADGTLIQAGDYLDAKSAPGIGNHRLQVYAGGRNCGALGVGFFKVLNVEYDLQSPIRSITRLALDFEYACGSSSPKLRGEFRLNSSVSLSNQQGYVSLSVSRLGVGAGTVSSLPVGINCGPDCSEFLVTNSSITLNAVAASGSQFGGWAGVVCAGGNTNANCSFTVATNATITATFTMASSAVVALHDLNDDGRSDIVWRNGSTGENWYWAMNGTTITAQGPITTLPVDWQIQSTAVDFDGDGKSDILLRNMTTGQPWVWFMNGNSIIGGGALPTLSDLNWTIAGTGDLNGDGKGDVIWRNTSTGANWWWAMNGTTIINQGQITGLPVDWAIQNTLGDFNGDGKTDILWRNTTTGQPWVWMMDGNTIINNGPLPTLSDLNWTIAGTGDLNGDGKHDVVWRNTATGANWYWALNGTTITAQGPITTLPTDWQIQSTSADFDGDGKADILLRNMTTGQPWVWFMVGNAIAGGGPLPTLSDMNWQIRIRK